MLFITSNSKLGIWLFSQPTIDMNSQSNFYDVLTLDHKIFFPSNIQTTYWENILHLVIPGYGPFTRVLSNFIYLWICRWQDPIITTMHAQTFKFLGCKSQKCLQHIIPRRDVSGFSREGVYFNWKDALVPHQVTGEASKSVWLYDFPTSKFQASNAKSGSVWIWSLYFQDFLPEYFFLAYLDPDLSSVSILPVVLLNSLVKLLMPPTYNPQKRRFGIL